MFPKFNPITQFTSLYLHIPFCRKICPFCSFTVRLDRKGLHQEYVDALLKELELNLKYKHKKISTLKSLYLGGGTPSRMGLNEIRTLVNGIRSQWKWDSKIEITLECNPEDLTREFLEGLLESDINRISLGGQSFNDNLLLKLGRVHNSIQLRNAIKHLHYFSELNWNIDLMFGIPMQNYKEFCDDLSEAIEANPSHLSLYGLEIHPKTPFAHDKTISDWERKNPNLMSQMYIKAVKMLEDAGLKQYEISNFARENKESCNNIGVWNGKPYLGLGCGAHSFDGRRRWANKNSIRLYLNSIRHKKISRAFEEELNPIQLASETLMLALRQPKGLNIKEWRLRFGLEENDLEVAYFHRLKKDGHAVWESPFLKLTPKGMLFADAITTEIMPPTLT